MVLAGCSNALPRGMQWQEAKHVGRRWEKLRTGDIIIKDKRGNPLTWFGHAAIVIEDGNIGDYPKIGVNYYEIDSYSWLYEKRGVVILRYRYYDERFQIKIMENLEKYNKGKYRIHLDKRSNKNFYCSQFVWIVYYMTAKELGYELDIDSDGGKLVTPYDILYSSDLEQVYIE